MKSTNDSYAKVQRLMSKLGAPMLNKEIYIQVQSLMDKVGESLL